MTKTLIQPAGFIAIWGFNFVGAGTTREDAEADARIRWLSNEPIEFKFATEKAIAIVKKCRTGSSYQLDLIRGIYCTEDEAEAEQERLQNRLNAAEQKLASIKSNALYTA